MAVSGRLARFYPSHVGVAARIGLILIGAVVLSIGISTAFIFILGETSTRPPLIPAKALAEQILTAYRRIDATPNGARAAVTAEVTGAIVKISWPVPAPFMGQGLPPGYLQDLKTFIQLGLNNPGRGVVLDTGPIPGFGPPMDAGPPDAQPMGGPLPNEQGPTGQPLPRPPLDYARGGPVPTGFLQSGLHTAAPSLRVLMQLHDGSWVSIDASHWRSLPFPLVDFLDRVVPISAVCLLLALFVIRGFMRPIVHLAAAAERLGIEGDVSMVEERVAPEMRAAACAFNEMQLRLRRLIDDRTQMLAAISHDLKTPITRLRLRAEFIEDAALQEKMLADLTEMEAMVASTLAFARSDARSETAETIDIADMLQSLVEAHADSGNKAAYEGPVHLTLKARPVALRRAFANLIDNAIKYGGLAEVALRVEGDRAVVTIEDSGPGIAPDQMELVFRPYYRLEASRNRETGGVGLGLSIARAAIRADRGDITLENRASGGLRVRVVLPVGTGRDAVS